MNLPAWNKDHSLYRYACQGRKFRGRFAGVLLFVRSGDDIRRRRPGFAVALADCPLCGRTYPMTMNLSTEVRMIKGLGPQRTELLAQRCIHTLEDLLGYLPFRYEDRIHFSRVKDIQPNGVYTIRARVMSGQAVRTMPGRDAIYHLLVQDEPAGLLPVKFFYDGSHGGRF